MVACDPPKDAASPPPALLDPPKDAASPPLALLDRLVKAGTIILSANIRGDTSLTFTNEHGGSFQAAENLVSGLPTNIPVSKQSIEEIAKDPTGEYSNLRSAENIFAIEDTKRNSYVLTDQKLSMVLVVVEIPLVVSLVLPNAVHVFELNIRDNDIRLKKTSYREYNAPLISSYAEALKFARRIDPATLPQGTTLLKVSDPIIYTGSF